MILKAAWSGRNPTELRATFCAETLCDHRNAVKDTICTLVRGIKLMRVDGKMRVFVSQDIWIYHLRPSLHIVVDSNAATA